MPKIEQSNIRRFYYIGSLVILFLTVSLMSIPIYFSIENEFQNKIKQLEHTVIEQKKIFLKTVIVEKINDIEQQRILLKKLYPHLKKNEFDTLFRENVRSLIYNTKLPDNGYIWINEIVNFEGGDNYAIRFVHPNLSETEGDYLSTKTTDFSGNLPYLEELNGIKAEGKTFFEYVFKKMGSEKISHKLSYAELYPLYNWVVGTGVYLDDVDHLIEAEVSRMKETTDKTLLQITLIILVTLTVLIIMLVLFEKKIHVLISNYVTSLEKSKNNLQLEKEKLEKAYEQIENMAYTDYLTGLYNRRAMIDHIKLEESRAKRENIKYGLLMCDIDYFKKINDSYGHEAGDHILKEISLVLKKSTRLEDSLCRWGGEEFLCMIVNVDMHSIIETAEKLRSTINNHTFHYKGAVVKTSITIGVSIYNASDSIDELIKTADNNLYKGKEMGRNRVVS